MKTDLVIIVAGTQTGNSISHHDSLLGNFVFLDDIVLVSTKQL